MPGLAHDVERIGRHAREAMIGRTHDESRAVRDLTEFADDKLVAEDRMVEKNLRFFKVLRMFRAVVVGIVAYKNIGCRYDIFQKDGCFVLVRKITFGSGFFGWVTAFFRSGPAFNKPVAGDSESADVNLVRSRLSHDGFGVVGKTKACGTDHFQIVGAVAASDALKE